MYYKVVSQNVHHQPPPPKQLLRAVWHLWCPMCINMRAAEPEISSKWSFYCIIVVIVRVKNHSLLWIAYIIATINYIFIPTLRLYLCVTLHTFSPPAFNVAQSIWEKCKKNSNSKMDNIMSRGLHFGKTSSMTVVDETLGRCI